MTREQPPVRIDPLSEAAARRHELTRAKAVQALRELDRAACRDIAAVAQAAGISRSWLYTQPDISGQIRRLRTKGDGVGSAAIPAGQRATNASRAPGSPPPSTATSSLPTRTPGSAASARAHSATSGRHGTRSGNDPQGETAGIGPRASRRRHCPRRDAAGHGPG